MNPENQPPLLLQNNCSSLYSTIWSQSRSNEKGILSNWNCSHANGSVLCSFGNTQVICAAMIEDQVPGWMRQQKVEGG